MTTFIFVMLCLALILGPVIHFKLPSSRKEDLIKTVQIMGGLIAALSLALAAYSYYSTQEAAKTNAAIQVQLARDKAEHERKLAEDSAQHAKKLAEDDAKLQRQLAASDLYREHMRISIDNPNFLQHSRLARMTPPTEKSSQEARWQYRPYQWYVGHALFSFESMMEVMGDDTAWDNTFARFIEAHKTYIGTEAFPCWRYTERLQEMVKNKTGRTTCEEPKTNQK